MIMGFTNLAVNSRVNDSVANNTKFKMRDKLVEAGRQTIHSNRPQVGSYLANGAPRTGLSVEPADFAYTKFVLAKAKETFTEKVYSKSALIKGNEPQSEDNSVKHFSESKIAELYKKSDSSES
jgi:hypothetical protein